MKIVERLAGNTFYLFADWLAVTVLSFLFWVIVWKSLPPESAGIISTSVNMIILISTFGVFGMNATLTKLISEYSQKKQSGKIASLIRFSNKALATINVLLSLSFFSVVTYFGIDLKIPFEAIVAVAAGIVIWPLVHSTTSILQGLQNMKWIYKTDFLANILKLVLAGALVLAGFNFIGPIAAIVISYAAVLVLRRDVLQVGKKIKEKIDQHVVIYKFALPALVASVSWALFVNTPTIILTLLDSLKSTGLFAAALSLTSPLALVPAIISQAVFPITSELTGMKNHAEKQAKLIESVMRYVFFISLPMIIVYVFYAKAFVLVFTQIQYIEAVPLIPILGFAVLIQSMGQILVSSLFAIGKTKSNRNVYIGTAAVFLASSIPMTAMFGVNGLLSSFVISVFVFTLTSYVALRRSLSFSMPWKPIAKVAAPSFLLFVILYISFSFGLKALETIPSLAVGTFLYFWTLGKLRFYSKEDAMILRLAEGKVRSLRKPIGFVRGFVERNVGDN